MAVPNTFGTATAAIPLSQLDANFNTPITLGNTAIQLGDTVTTLNNMTLANVTISSGTVTITNVAVTTANVSGTANISTLVVTANASVAGNVTVSGNTVVTGNVTSATHILTGGTANGVVYLDTTKSLTTGSALVFDGTNLGVGITPTTKLHVSSASNTFATVESTNGAAYWQMIGNNATNASYNTLISKYGATTDWSISGGNGTSGTMVFSANGSEQMRLTSTGLGIGTSSPNIGGITRALTLNTPTGGNYSGVELAGAGTLSARFITNNAAGTFIGSQLSIPLVFETNATERARIDSSGNVGIGTSSPAKRLDVRQAYTTDTVVAQIGNTNNGNGSTPVATIFDFTEANGTAVSRISSIYTQSTGKTDLAFGTYNSGLSEKMRLDSSGNLGVGSTSPNIAGVNKAITLNTTNGTSGAIYEIAVSGTNYAYLFANASNTVLSSVQNLPLVFNTNNTERARIDSSGNLLVGTTTNGAGHRLVVKNTSDSAVSVNATNDSTSSTGVGTYSSSLGTGNAGNTNCYHFRGVTENVNIWYLYGNGTSSFTSDQRLKKNIETARNGYLDDLLQLRVVKYHWKANDEASPKELGLIAQEVEQVFPGLVQDADVEFDGVTPKVLKASVLPFMLLKAIQEQQAIIQSLTARITALEGA